MKKASLAIWLLLVGPAFAREAIRDDAGILDASTRQRVQSIADDMQRSTGKELLVATVKEIKQDARLDAQAMFREEKLNGVLIFIAPQQHQLGILPGRSTERLFPHSVSSPIREGMLARFRANDYAGGIVQGSQAVSDVLERGVAALPPNGGVRQQQAPASSFGFGWLMPVLLFGGCSWHSAS